jgi:hypothetical protein
MKDIIDVLILMGATQVIHDVPKNEFMSESLSFNFNSKNCWIGAEAANTESGYLVCEVSKQNKINGDK